MWVNTNLTRKTIIIACVKNVKTDLLQNKDLAYETVT